LNSINFNIDNKKILKLTSKNQISRIIKILELLSIGKSLTASKLYDYFDKEVSIRTLQRDFITIESAGIPLSIELNDKKEQEWCFTKDYRKMLLPSIQKNELLSLYILKSYLKGFNNTIIGSNLNTLLEKLEEIAPGDVFIEPHDQDGQENLFWNQDYGIFDYENYDSTIEKIINAVSGKQWLKLTYHSMTDYSIKTYEVFPQKLFVFQQTLYLVVFFPKYKDNLALAVHRIKEINSIDNSKPIPPFNLAEFRKKRFGVFTGQLETIELLVNPNFTKWFRERQWHPTQEIIENQDNTLTIKMTVPVTPDFLTWLIGWSEGVIVLSPPSLRDLLKQKLSKILSQYE